METILSIAGKPGLYKLVSRGKMNLIVEALDETHKRIPAFATDRVTSLGDIAIYTTAFTTATSRNCCNGMTSWLKRASLILKKCWHRPRATTLTTAKQLNKLRCQTPRYYKTKTAWFANKLA